MDSEQDFEVVLMSQRKVFPSVVVTGIKHRWFHEKFSLHVVVFTSVIGLVRRGDAINSPVVAGRVQ